MRNFRFNGAAVTKRNYSHGAGKIAGRMVDREKGWCWFSAVPCNFSVIKEVS
jgi:hypothetical protein